MVISLLVYLDLYEYKPLSFKGELSSIMCRLGTHTANLSATIPTTYATSDIVASLTMMCDGFGQQVKMVSKRWCLKKLH